MKFGSVIIKRSLPAPFTHRCLGERGNILVYIVMIMVIFGLLGAVMVSLFSTSISSSATPNQSRRALFLFESGVRYGMSELRNTGFLKSTIDRLNSTTYNMNPNGSFEVNAFSPWFESASNQTIETSGSVQLNVARGKIPTGFMEKIPTTGTLLRVVNYDYINLSGPGPQQNARAQVSDRLMIDLDTVQLQIDDDFVIGKGETICFSVNPFAAGQSIVTFGNFDLQRVARNIFPERDGAIRVRNCEYFYRTAQDLGDRIRLTNLSSNQIICSAPILNMPADEEIIFSPRNYKLTALGKSGDVIYGGDMDHSTGITSHTGLAPGDHNPDIAFQEEADLGSVLRQVEQSDKTGFITVDNVNKALTIGGETGSALGAVWFRDTRNIGGIKEFCNNQGCFFSRGIRVFFTLTYSGSGDGLVFALINGNGNKNDTASVGGDIEQSELLGYSGDSRLNTTGTLFLDNSGPQKGLIPPKIGLEFDTKINYSSTLEESLKYCSGSNLNADTRNDPGASGKDAVQYVFWGNSSLNVPCRKEPYCGGVSTCKGDPSYDDNRHNAVGDGTQNWSQSTGERIRSSPAVGADGTIYVGSYDGNLYAINPDGSLKWTFGTGDRVYSPTVAGSGTIYVGSADGNLYAVNPDGSFRWSYLTGGAVRTKPAVHTSGIVYFGSDDGRLYAVSSGGAFIWSFDTFAPVQSSPAFSNAGNIVYFGSDNGTFYGLTVGSGLIFGTITPSPANAFRSSPAVGPGPNGTIYVGSDNGSIYAFNSSLTSILWSVPTGEAVRSSPAVGSDGTVYIGSFNDYLYALDTSNGAEKWKFQAGSNVQSPIAIDGNNHIYFGSDDDKVYALYADGSVKWSFTTGGDVRGKPLVMPDGVVYAGSYDFRLYAINQFANPKNYRDRLITYTSGSVGGVPVSVDNTDDWLKGASSKGPWAVRMEIARSLTLSGGTYSYELKTWLRQCNQVDCSDVLGTFYEDTRIDYAPNTPTARPAQLEQTINLLPGDHQDFERFIFGFTSQTGSGDLQTATIRKFQLSFIRPGDPSVTNDPNWP